VARRSYAVRLINPRFVKPFVKGPKNDAIDAEAIFDAAMRPTMRFVPVKSLDQQDLQSLHRARERLICERTALINHTRGLLAEYGVVFPQGPWRFAMQAPTAIADADLSDLAREIFSELLDQLTDLNRRVEKLDAKLIGRASEVCRRLAKLPGVGPVIATATWRPWTMGVTSGQAVSSQLGSGCYHDNKPPGASHGSAALADAPTIT
jgi:transposase